MPIYSRIETPKLNGTDPRAWLMDVLARIADHPANRALGPVFGFSLK